jgi:excisionase family DNA binding protein
MLSQQEAAAFLRVSRMQVNRWVRAGQLKDVKILGTSRIRVSSLLVFAKRHGLKLVKGLFIV